MASTGFSATLTRGTANFALLFAAYQRWRTRQRAQRRCADGGNDSGGERRTDQSKRLPAGHWSGEDASEIVDKIIHIVVHPPRLRALGRDDTTAYRVLQWEIRIA